MKLLPNDLANSLPDLYDTENIDTEDKMIYVKFFSPFSDWTWYVAEYDSSDGTFFGLVDGNEREWGYFSLRELEGINAESNPPLIERDEYFTPTRIKDIQALK